MIKGKRHGKMIMWSCYLRPEQVKRLREISKKYRLPMSWLIRDGVDKTIKDRSPLD